MVISNSLTSFGKYCLFMRRVFTVPDKWKVFFSRTVFEISKLGVDSIPLVMVISIFIGAVIAIQMQSAKGAFANSPTTDSELWRKIPPNCMTSTLSIVPSISVALRHAEIAVSLCFGFMHLAKA